MISYRNVVIIRCCGNLVPPQASLTALSATSWRSLSPLQVSSSATHPPTHVCLDLFQSSWPFYRCNNVKPLIPGLSHNFWRLRGARWNGKIKQTSEKLQTGRETKLMRFNQQQQNYWELNTQRVQQLSLPAQPWVESHITCLFFRGGRNGIIVGWLQLTRRHRSPFVDQPGLLWPNSGGTCNGNTMFNSAQLKEPVQRPQTIWFVS